LEKKMRRHLGAAGAAGGCTLTVRTAVLIFAAIVLLARPAFPCSAFMRSTDAGPIVGKSYDWSDERGLVMINKRNVSKRALVLSTAAKPAAWTSRYTSLTFNQYGRELPNGGMNEEGLVVEVLMLPTSVFPPSDDRPSITELGLVQFMLDQAATLEQAAALAGTVCVSPVHAKVHYFVCDRTAACATLEFLSGKLVTTQGNDMPVHAITNSTYSESRQSLSARTKPKPHSSLARFNVLALRLKEPTRSDFIDQAWSHLDEVRFAGSTQWQVLYEISVRRVHFRTRTHPTVKTVSLPGFEPGRDAPVLMYDMLSDEQGDITARFVPYKKERNLALVTSTLKPLKKTLPPGIVSRVAGYPETLKCLQ
jgi:hypothetical protein